MPFEQKYSRETREAATARVLERRAADPKDRSILRVVAEEFNVGEQSLRGWVNKMQAGAVRTPVDTPRTRKARPKFSPVVTSKVEGAVGHDEVRGERVLTEARAAMQVAAVERIIARRFPSTGERIDELEAEVAALRRDNETLKSAMRVLLDD